MSAAAGCFRIPPELDVCPMDQPAASAPKPDGRRERRGSEGIALRHRRHCPYRTGAPCRCRPTYQAQVWSPRDRKPIRRTFPTLAEARAWRQEAQVAVRQQKLRLPSRRTLAEAAEAWLDAAKAGVIRTRSGEPYKPSALRSYEEALRTKALPALGRRRLSAIDRNAIQDLVDSLIAYGHAPSTVRNAVLPLRAIYRRALARSEVAFNPTIDLALPGARARRERIARPEEAAALIAALPASDRVLWATALYAGLRRGELQALEWQSVDLDARVVSVERSWDRSAGPIEPKSRSGRRRVPVGGRPSHRAARATPTPGARRHGARLRSTSRAPLRPTDRGGAGEARVGAGGAEADRSTRVPPHLRRVHDRRGSQRQGALHLHGALFDHRDPRPLRPPHARQRG